MAIRIHISSVVDGTPVPNGSVAFSAHNGALTPVSPDTEQEILLSSVTMADVDRIRQVCAMANAGALSDAVVFEGVNLADSVDAAFATVFPA